MNTTAHVLMGAALCGHRDRPAVTASAVGGSLLPDAAIIGMVAWQGWVVGRTGEQIFREDYYDPFWQEVFAIFNSLPLYLAVAVAGWLLGRSWLMALGMVALIHVLTDMPLHVDDGHPPFWPFLDWIYESPWSYWDVNHGARIIAPLEVALSAVLAAYLWFRLPHPLMRIAVAATLAAEALFALGGEWIYG